MPWHPFVLKAKGGFPGSSNLLRMELPLTWLLKQVGTTELMASTCIKASMIDMCALTSTTDFGLNSNACCL